MLQNMLHQSIYDWCSMFCKFATFGRIYKSMRKRVVYYLNKSYEYKMGYAETTLYIIMVKRAKLIFDKIESITVLT